MMFGWIIGLVLVVVLIIALGRGGIFQRNAGITAANNNSSTAMETLKTRYAKGEIDKAEFEKRKAELEKTN
ncbi:MAG: SHOCT domain-containing protein [Candidatus Paceibacterota bacterium]